MRKLILTSAIAISGCATLPDQDQLISASLQIVERDHRVDTIVLSSALALSARVAAGHARLTVEEADLNSKAGVGGPHHYLYLREVTIQGDAASVSASLPTSDKHVLACGTNYEISFNRKGGRWYENKTEILAC